MHFDETGPNTHTRRYWVSATIGIAAMIVFALLSVLLLLGVVFGSPQVKPVADSLFPWSLLVFAVACVAMFVANARPRWLCGGASQMAARGGFPGRRAAGGWGGAARAAT